MDMTIDNTTPEEEREDAPADDDARDEKVRLLNEALDRLLDALDAPDLAA